MVDLTTRYMGLSLPSPIIAGSSGLTGSVDKISQLESAGAGAVVLKSIFEEQIMMEADAMRSGSQTHTEESDYITQYTRSHNIDQYLKLINTARESARIPIIASINCISSDQWVSFARQIENAGADGLELNLFIMPAQAGQKGEEIETNYFNIIKGIQEHITIPLSVKIGVYFSGLANFVFNLAVRDVRAIVLFNRFYIPDIDLESENLVAGNILSHPSEISLPLRWVGLLSEEVKCDLAASTGIHDGKAVIKCLLAGAKAVHIASCLYQKGPDHIRLMTKQMEEWMKAHSYGSVKEFAGKLSYQRLENPVIYQRAQFMKYFSDAKI